MHSVHYTGIIVPVVLKNITTANLIELTTSKFQNLFFFPNSPASILGLATCSFFKIFCSLLLGKKRPK